MTDHVHDWRGHQAKSCLCGKTPDDECKFGHPRTDENAYINGKGVWCCRVCRKTHNAVWRSTNMTPERHEEIKSHMRNSAKNRHAELRQSALDAYGNKCACCGESTKEFLAIDHVDNDGSSHRKEIGASGSTSTYRWLKKNDYPAGFQILCHNCNFAKHVYKTCPHQQEVR